MTEHTISVTSEAVTCWHGCGRQWRDIHEAMADTGACGNEEEN